MLFVISGPSGCGKSTLIRRVVVEMRKVRFSVSHTTRPIRTREVDGRDYHFITKEEFERMIAAEAFLEWAEVHGNYYGTARSEVESQGLRGDVLLDIDVQGARQVRARQAGAVLVFVVPPSFEELRARIEKRAQDEPQVIQRRLQAAQQEVEASGEFDYLVINDELDRAVGDLKSIIRASRCRLAAQRPRLEAVLDSFRRGSQD